MVKLQDYLPDYYDDVYEMQKLVAAEQVDFTKFDDLVLRTLLNQFVTQTDLQGISLFEDQLGIDPDPNDTLETRQYNVLMRMLPPQPITLKYFKKLLHTLDIPTQINVEYAIRHVETIAKRSEISKAQIQRLKYLLNVYLPANLTFQIIVTSESNTDLNEYFGATQSGAVSAKAEPKLKSYSDTNIKQFFGGIKPGMASSAFALPKLISTAESRLLMYLTEASPQSYVHATVKEKK
ncbi:putative phage tail protein [Companilactobacillus hulinensis]|uniref:putative phage tail protein n=1 Tax=Companilactobacillus hulinensis TaxID=2486007 RepID=UPI000F77237C|nr:putative phage tail protein [Companilactobacillus hulinensis]